MNSSYCNEIIFATTQERAELMLKKLAEGIELTGVEQFERISKDFIITNRRKIRAIGIGKNCRGYRCSDVYVDMDITIKMLHSVIYPTLNNAWMMDGRKCMLSDRVHYFEVI